MTMLEALACRGYVDSVNAYLEDELDEEHATNFELHTLVCEGCARYLDQMRATIRLVRRGKAESLEPLNLEPTARGVVGLKFLKKGRIGSFSGFVWPTDAWVWGRGAPRACRRGIHACRLDDLPYWLGEELWTVELAEPVVRRSHKLVSPAGRLGRRVTNWNEDTASRFANDCASRVQSAAITSLREAGLDAHAQKLSALHGKALILELDDLSVRKTSLGPAHEYVVAAASSLVEPPFAAASAAAYVACLAAAQAGGIDGHRTERQRQAEWLQQDMGLGERLPSCP